MAIKSPPTEDTALNMTPMIDIVFQLILFFMFNLRFKGLDHRIDTQIPKDRGIQATATFVTDIPAIKVALFRLNEERKDAQTKIKVAGTEYMIPVSIWTGSREQDLALDAARDAVFKKIEAHIAGLFAANKELKGEIDAPPPKGGSVPHADVMKVLDAFLAAGLKDVNFQGAASPLPKSAKKQP
jgi:biopolymer transport protein ExbD